jgi:thiamine pyrophosphate-dependent acetolactate synthase large subunit-like protein
VCKYAVRPNSIENIPRCIEKAVRMSMYGTPGPVYIDLSQDIIMGDCKPDEIFYRALVEPLPKMILPNNMVS